MAVVIVWKDAPFIIRDRDAVKLDEPPLCLGRGANGEVHAGTYQGNQIAKKTLYLSTMLIDGRPLRGAERDTILNALHKECEILAQIQSSHVVRFFGMTLNTRDEPESLVMERLVPFTSIYPPDVAVDPISWRLIAFDVLRGLQALANSNPPVIHRDLKPSNLLIAPDGKIKLADLGLARAGVSKTLTLGVGSLAYMAPELRDETAKASSAIDCFSFGVMMMELWLGESPNPSPEMRSRRAVPELERRAIHLARLPADEKAITDVITACLLDEPVARPTCSAILAMIATDSRMWGVFATLSSSTAEDVAQRTVRLLVTSIDIATSPSWLITGLRAVENLCGVSDHLRHHAHRCGVVNVILKTIRASADHEEANILSVGWEALSAVVKYDDWLSTDSQAPYTCTAYFAQLLQTDDLTRALAAAWQVHNTEDNKRAVFEVLTTIVMISCFLACDESDVVSIYYFGSLEDFQEMKDRLSAWLSGSTCTRFLGSVPGKSHMTLYRSELVRLWHSRAIEGKEEDVFGYCFLLSMLAAYKDNRVEMVHDGVVDVLIQALRILLPESEPVDVSMLIPVVQTLKLLIETNLLDGVKVATVLSCVVKFMRNYQDAELPLGHAECLKLVRTAGSILFTVGSDQHQEMVHVSSLNADIITGILGSMEIFWQNTESTCSALGIDCLQIWPVAGIGALPPEMARDTLRFICGIENPGIAALAAAEHQVTSTLVDVLTDDIVVVIFVFINDVFKCNQISPMLFGNAARFCFRLSQLGVNLAEIASENVSRLENAVASFPDESMLQEFGVQVLDLLQRGSSQTAVTAISKHMGNTSVLIAALNILWRATLHESRGLVTRHILRLIKHIMQSQQQHQKVARSMMRLLSSLCMEDDSVEVLLRDGLVFIHTCEILKVHYNMEDIQRDGCRILFFMTRSPRVAQLGLRNYTNVLDAAVAQFTGNEDIQLYGRLAAQQMASRIPA